MKTKLLAVCLFLVTMNISADEAKIFRYGTGIRINSFGIPNALLDMVFFEHPQLNGTAMSFEIHSYGDKGPRSVFSGIYCLEYSRLSGEGNFRVEQYDNRLYGSGEVTQISFTATILMHVFPSLPLHPYIGAGLGLGWMSIWAEGSRQDELGTTINESYKKKTIIPVGHIPVGVIGNINNKFLLRVEVGFKNGFYLGGGIVINF